MNPKEPHSFTELAAWLEYVAITSGFRAPPCPDGREQHDTAQSIHLPLFQYELPFAAAIETAADKLWLHEAEAFQDLPPEAASLLHLRIETAKTWIEEFLTSEEAPLDYPDGAFQEVIHWLLVGWWKSQGIHRACVHYFLYA